MVSTERDSETKLDAQTFTCFASRCGAIPRHRMERSTLVGKASTLCLRCSIAEEFVAGKVAVRVIAFVIQSLYKVQVDEAEQCAIDVEL